MDHPSNYYSMHRLKPGELHMLARGRGVKTTDGSLNNGHMHATRLNGGHTDTGGKRKHNYLYCGNTYWLAEWLAD